VDADRLAVTLMVQAEYDPNSAVDLLNAMEKLSHDIKRPQYLTNHPDPGNRAARILGVIREQYGDGLRSGLRK
jgi:predicted Zn-dependent protease